MGIGSSSSNAYPDPYYGSYVAPQYFRLGDRHPYDPEFIFHPDPFNPSYYNRRGRSSGYPPYGGGRSYGGGLPYGGRRSYGGGSLPFY